MSKPLRITWINPEQIDHRQSPPTTNRVCVRLRCIGPSSELIRRGHDVRAVSMPEWPQWANQPEFYGRDVYIVGKAFIDLSPTLQNIHDTGGKVVIDICDNVFEPPEDELKPIYEAIIPYADGVVMSSETLRGRIAGRLGRRVATASISDTVEGNQSKPAFAPSSALRLLWFGYPNNLQTIYDFMPELVSLAQSLPLELTLVTSWQQESYRVFQSVQTGFRKRPVKWSVEAMARELERCDMVVIPSDDNPYRITKSANRVITSLWAGRYVVAYPLPSYMEFARFAGIGKDMTGGIKWALENPTAVVDRISAGQDFIASNYSAGRIGAAWESFLQSLFGNRVNGS